MSGTRRSRTRAARRPPALRRFTRLAVEQLETRLSPNVAPLAPVITEPVRDGLVVSRFDVHMETAPFQDADPPTTPDGQHLNSDFEILQGGVPVWRALGITGLAAVHVHFGDGAFVGTHAGRSSLLPETDYVLRIVHRDASGDPATDTSPPALRAFRTSPDLPPGDPTQRWTVAPGYIVEEVATDFRLPVNIAFVPNPGPNPTDPFYYVNELYGTIRVVFRDGSQAIYAGGDPTVFGGPPGASLVNFNPIGGFPGQGEQGLTGLAVDPVSGDLFVSLVHRPEVPARPGDNPPHYGRVLRLHSDDGGRTAATTTLLFDTFGIDENQGQSHQISNVTIGPDGKLYVHNGEGFVAARAQNLDRFGGKILRMELDGSPVQDNPFFTDDGVNTARDYVFASGLRNPFGGAWNAASQHFTVENGPGSNDRLSLLVPGRNYGWNGTDASMLNFATFTWAQPHAPVNIAFVGPETFGGSGFPAGSQGHAFVSLSGPTNAQGPQGARKSIQEFAFNPDGSLQSGPTQLVQYNGTGFFTVAGLAAGPDGLYFSTLYRDVNGGGANAAARGASVFRVRFVGAANFTFDLPDPAQPLTVRFTDQSNVPEATEFSWDFGDGSPHSRERNPVHTYAQPGVYDVTLTVTGSGGPRTVTQSIPVAVVVGFNAQYFNHPAGSATPNNIPFFTSTAPVLTRIDARIDLTDAGAVVRTAGEVAPGVQANDFAVRWTGRLRPRFSETYTFRSRTDDGVRLWVNNTLIINNWTLHGPTNDLGTITLQAGVEVDIKLEFFERGGGALAQLFWRSPSQPEELVPANRVFPTEQSTALTPPARLRASVTFADVSLDWIDDSDNEIGFRVERSTNGGPFVEVGTVGANVTVFTDTVPAGGQYAYRVQSLGAVDNSISSNTVTVAAGPAADNGFRAEYFNLPGGQALPDNLGFFTTAAPALVRSDPTIDVNDSTGGVVRNGGVALPNVQLNDFAVRWTGLIRVPTSGDWTFRSRTDDGVRVWVNNTLIVNNWTLHGPTNDRGVIALEAGVDYDIKMEFFERAGGALAQLFWSGPGQPEQLVPALAVTPTEQSIALTPPSRVRVLGTTAAGVSLDWIDDSDNETGFQIERSADGVTFDVVDVVGANVRTFADQPVPGTYRYRVRAVNDFGVSIPGVSGPIVLEPFNLDKSDGFAVNSDLVANNGAAFVGTGPTIARLTPNVNNRSGSIFTAARVPVSSFFTAFTFQIHGGTATPADGLTFTIQSNRPNILGAGGGSLGYAGIGNSIAVKFDIFDGGTIDPSDSTVGLFVNGAGPFGGLNTLPAGIDFRTGRVFQADLGYDDGALTLRVVDLTTGASFATTFNVDIPAIIGSDTAFVGFTGATGGLNANHDIRTWVYQALPVPRTPSNLRTTEVSGSAVALAWDDTSWNETGFQVERSTDGGATFEVIGLTGGDVTTFYDTTSGRGIYRVRALNGFGLSGPSTAIAAGPITLDFSAGFANPVGLIANQAAAFVGDAARLTPAIGSAAGSIFSAARVGIRNFTTSFTFRIHGGSNPPADGLTFTIQGSSPNALGQFGTGLGYGQENPGQPITVGIPRSVAIKFDNFQGLDDPSPSTTGLFTNGQGPFGGTDTLPAGIDFRLPDVFRVDLSYDGTVLQVTITNTRTGATFGQTHPVDIAQIVGGDTAFVGFTAGTGGLTANHDVQTWRFDSL